MVDQTIQRFNVGIFGFSSGDVNQTDMIKSINSLLHEVHLRVADQIKPAPSKAEEKASLDLYVCPSLAGDIWLKSFDDCNADFYCVTMDTIDNDNPFVKNASAVTMLDGGTGSFNETHTIIEYIAAKSDMIITLWDGDDQSRNGMIWNLLRIAAATSIPCIQIDVNHPDQRLFFDRYAIEPFSSHRLKEYVYSLCDEESVDVSNLQGRHVFLSKWWEKLYNHFINKYKAQVKQLPYVEDMLMNPAYAGQDESMCRPNQQKLAEKFGHFDGIALQMAKKYRESIYFRSILPFILTIAISVGFYIETLLGLVYKFQGGMHNFWMFIAGIGFLLHALINLYGDYISRSKDVKDRHSVFLKSRYLAEYMRVAVHFLPFGIPLSPSFSKDKALSAQVRRIFRSLEPASHTFNKGNAENILKHSLLLINDQITYHTNTRSRLKAVAASLEKAAAEFSG